MPPEIKLEAVLAAMTDAVVISDKGGTFIDFNEPFARLNRFKTKSACALALKENGTVAGAGGSSRLRARGIQRTV